jgi:hypothetical protein
MSTLEMSSLLSKMSRTLDFLGQPTYKRYLMTSR